MTRDARLYLRPVRLRFALKADISRRGPNYAGKATPYAV